VEQGAPRIRFRIGCQRPRPAAPSLSPVVATSASIPARSSARGRPLRLPWPLRWLRWVFHALEVRLFSRSPQVCRERLSRKMLFWEKFSRVCPPAGAIRGNTGRSLPPKGAKCCRSPFPWKIFLLDTKSLMTVRPTHSRRSLFQTARVSRESSLANQSPQAYFQLAFFQVSAPLQWKMRTGCPNEPVKISRFRRFASWSGTSSTIAPRSPAPPSNAP
jgi:hypothetical protein